MAIVQEHFDINGRDFIRTYSDSNKYVVRDGVEYSEACDPAEFNRTYTETSIPIDDDTTAEDLLSILIGE